ncbi:MAG: Spy/CpxP family protein refolding chaperone [Terracidiphilus sp.]
MKRVAIWSCVAVLLGVTAVAVARANVRGWHGCPGHRWGHFGAMGFVAHELNLTDVQKQQIRSMWQAERPAVSGLVQEFSAESKEMDQATANGNLDESKVQEIATRQGITLSKLLVEKEHFKTKIYASVLNPEQRTKADKLQSQWHERLDHIGKGME